MLEQDLKNNKIIEGLVYEFFSLDGNSDKRFKELLKKPKMAKPIEDLFKGSEDLRIRYKITDEHYEFIDTGWTEFKESFPAFCSTHNISYVDFRSNKVTIDKQKVKLGKSLKKYYYQNLERSKYDLRCFCDDYNSQQYLEVMNGCKWETWEMSAEEVLSNRDMFRFTSKEEAKELAKKMIDIAIERQLERIGAMKLPVKEEMEIVISRNFADWMLCSTKENWTSCINLESNYENAYWSGLPGTIADSNRMMIYITDGEKKSYNGITTDRFIQRSWVLLDENQDYHPLVWYDQKKVTNKMIKQITGLNLMVNTGKHFDCYESFKPLRFINGDTCFIYQDNSQFATGIDQFGRCDIIGRGESDVCYFDRHNQLTFDVLFDSSRMENGFSTLLELNDSIYEFFEVEEHKGYDYSQDREFITAIKPTESIEVSKQPELKFTGKTLPDWKISVSDQFVPNGLVSDNDLIPVWNQWVEPVINDENYYYSGDDRSERVVRRSADVTRQIEQNHLDILQQRMNEDGSVTLHHSVPRQMSVMNYTYSGDDDPSDDRSELPPDSLLAQPIHLTQGQLRAIRESDLRARDTEVSRNEEDIYQAIVNSGIFDRQDDERNIV